MSRWWLKKLTRRIVSGIGSLATKNLNPHVRALTYHRFGHCHRDPFCIDPKIFEAQVAYIKEHDLATSLDALTEQLKGESTVSKPQILITIDDGHESTHSIAFPILKKYQIPAVAFITPSLIGQTKELTDAPEGYMSWMQVADLAANDIAIGCHAWTHRPLTLHDADALDKETTYSKKIIEHELSNRITSFAYPFGTRADYNDQTERAIRASGYRTAFTSQHGAILANTNPLELPRVKVEGGDPMWLFEQLVLGSMDLWRYVDAVLWRFQARVTE